jgi:puromycin-sensitive aminopeptidase
VGNTYEVPVTTSPSSSTPSDPSKNPYRLPRTATPHRYDLTLAPDLNKRDFMGEVRVTLTVHEPINEVVCNANELVIHKAWVVSENGTRFDATVSLDAEKERATFKLAANLQPGAATLHVHFQGELNDKLNGFYASTYTADDGSTKVIATTQMESTDARKAFPCWDEPDLKAIFAITLVVAEGLTAISNMHELSSTTLATGKRSVHFADTPVMSTYIVAMVVGELEITPPVDVDGIPLRVIARPGTLDQSDFALRCGAFALRYFQEWYGIPYPGTKLDLIATPDFAFGAMENLGAVTFRENLLLVSEDRTSRVELERVVDVISHEIAHMWFGDLVTMKWWDGIWLNEAFATFAETSCTAKYHPEWDRWTSFAQSRTMAFEVDSLVSTRPIEFEVISPADAEGMFDVLTYEKGGSVLRMMEQYLGEERFRDGVRDYLRTHSFSNTETVDLWDAIEHVAKEPVRDVMNGWILQGGFPLVTASLDTATNKLQLSQRRFLFDQTAQIPAQTWRVPVIYTLFNAAGSTTEARVLLGAEGESLTVPAGTTAVIVNSGGHGFYRVAYDAPTLAAAQALIPTLPAIDRYQLVGDAWASVLSGTHSAATYLSLVDSFVAERNPNVWAALLSGLHGLHGIADEPGRAAIEQKVRTLITPIVNELGWTKAPGEDSITGELRGQLIRALGGLGNDQATLHRAGTFIDELIAGAAPVPSDVAPAVVALAAKTGDVARYEKYLRAKSEAATPPEQRRYLMALAQFIDPVIVQRTLQSTLTDTIRNQDGPLLLLSMMLNDHNATATWTFVQSNWAALEAHFPSNLLPRMCEGLSSLSDPAIADSVVAHFTTGAGLALAQRSKTVVQHLELLKVNRALRDREHNQIAAAIA